MLAQMTIYLKENRIGSPLLYHIPGVPPKNVYAF